MSEDIFEQVMKNVAKINSERDMGYISLEFLEQMTEPIVDERYVIKNNDRLTREYRYLTSAYGFEDFHSLYTYAVSNEEEYAYKATTPPEGGGKKDFTKLNRTKRTVMRNGQPMETYIYEKPEGQDNRTKSKQTKGSKGNKSEATGDEPAQQETFVADWMNKVVLGEFAEPVSREDVKAVKNITDKLDPYIGEFTDVDTVIMLVDDNMQVHAVLGMTLFEEHLQYEYVYASQVIEGLEKRMVLELIRMALQIKKGVVLPESRTPTVNLLMETSGLELEEDLGIYISDYEVLEEFYGDITLAE